MTDSRKEALFYLYTGDNYKSFTCTKATLKRRQTYSVSQFTINANAKWRAYHELISGINPQLPPYDPDHDTVLHFRFSGQIQSGLWQELDKLDLAQAVEFYSGNSNGTVVIAFRYATINNVTTSQLEFKVVNNPTYGENWLPGTQEVEMNKTIDLGFDLNEFHCWDLYIYLTSTGFDNATLRFRLFQDGELYEEEEDPIDIEDYGYPWNAFRTYISYGIVLNVKNRHTSGVTFLGTNEIVVEEILMEVV